jgi:RecB family exonuclease
MLGRQARCPLRAFAQYRLGARELDEIGFGVPARIRGIAIHRAAQLAYANVRDRASVASIADAALDAAVEHALNESFLRTRAALRSLFELEAERLRAVLALLLERETAREPFEIVALEQELEARLDRWSLRLRVDRVDRLVDGRIAILDYKTGEGAAASDWFAERLRDAQVPLYAIQPATAVGAAVLVKLGATSASYLGIWDGAAFPGRPARLPLESWRAQLEQWRRQLEQLAAEFAAGDTRIFLAERDDALGAYAPLSRLNEQLALARGALSSW